MANNINNNPFILDTAADNIVAPGQKLYPKSMVYSGGTAAAHIASVEDGNEVEKCTLTITGAGQTVAFNFPAGFEMDGLSLGTLSSGKAYLYF
jgi:hypothetical protein